MSCTLGGFDAFGTPACQGDGHGVTRIVYTHSFDIVEHAEREPDNEDQYVGYGCDTCIARERAAGSSVVRIPDTWTITREATQ